MPGHDGGRESPTYELEKALLAPGGTPEILQGTALCLPPRLLWTSRAVDSDITFRSFLEILTRQSTPLSFFSGRGGRHLRCSRMGSKHRPCHRQRANRLRSRQRDPFLALSLLEAVAMLHSLRPSTTSSPSPLPLATASALLFARPVTFKHVSGALALERPVAGGKSEKVGPPPREGEAHTLFEDWKGYLLSVSGKPLSTLSSNSLLFWWRQNESKENAGM